MRARPGPSAVPSDRVATLSAMTSVERRLRCLALGCPGGCRGCPPRLAWDMCKRFMLGSALVVVLMAARHGDRRLLQVADIAHAVFPQLAIPRQAQGHAGAGRGAPETILDDRLGQAGAGREHRSTAPSPPHSDTLMLIRMDPSQGQTSVLSIPRDLQVTIHGPPRGRSQKINAAYTIGGAEARRQDGQAPAAGRQDQPHRRRQLPGLSPRRRRRRLRLRRRRPALLQLNAGAGSARATRPSTSSPATRSCAARRRWTTCATATPTRTSCASRASRTSSASSRSRSASRAARQPDQLLERAAGSSIQTDIHGPRRRSACQAGRLLGRPARAPGALPVHRRPLLRDRDAVRPPAHGHDFLHRPRPQGAPGGDPRGLLGRRPRRRGAGTAAGPLGLTRRVVPS